MRTRSVWSVMAVVAAFLGILSEARADILYVSQERNVQATAAGGLTIRQDAPNFDPFNVLLRVQSPVDDSLGTGIQDSTLGASLIRARGEGRGYSNNGSISTGTGTSVMNVVFDVPFTTDFRLDGVLRRLLLEDSRPTASVEMTGPSGQVFFYTFPTASPLLIDFSGPRAVSGVIGPGRYTLLASAFGVGYLQEQAAWFDFSLTIPAPGWGVVVIVSVTFAVRRNRPHSAPS